MMQLSAHALKVLDDGCPRAFALKYKADRYWPADENRAATFLGTAFHILVQQHALGLDVTAFVEALANDAPALPAVWARFLASEHAHMPAGARTWDEQALHFRVGGAACMARLDRVVREGDRWTILDWKTGRADPDKLRNSWQARLYPFALVEAGHVLAGEAIAPEAVTLTFWAVERGEAIHVPYDAATHAAVRAQVAGLAARAARDFDAGAADCANFPRRPKARCTGCGYYQLCNPAFPDLPAPPAAAPPRFIAVPASPRAVKRPNA